MKSLRDALSSEYDSFYASLLRVAFKQCLDYQSTSNEEPFYPPLTDSMGPTLGEKFRQPTPDTSGTSHGAKAGEPDMISETGEYGETYDPDAIEKSARPLSDGEVGSSTVQVRDFYTEL